MERSEVRHWWMRSAWDLPTVLPGTKAGVCSTPSDAPLLSFSPVNSLCHLPFLWRCQCWERGNWEALAGEQLWCHLQELLFPPLKSLLLRILLSGEERISSKVATLFMRRGEMSCPVPLAALHCDFNRALGDCHWDVGCAIRRFVTFFPCKPSWQMTWDDTVQTHHQHCQWADLLLFIHLICIWVICIPVTMLSCLRSCHNGLGWFRDKIQ